MKSQIRAAVGIVTGAFLSLNSSAVANAQVSDTSKKEAVVTKNASGTFDVKLTPQPLADSTRDTKLGRMSIEKQFSGGLQGTSKGEMLAAGTGARGSSGGYVAIERVTGSLNGKKGSFVLQHNGTMDRGTPHLVITVVPGSGTDELKGLSGRMTINIADGKHSYVFEYTLPRMIGEGAGIKNNRKEDSQMPPKDSSLSNDEKIVSALDTEYQEAVKNHDTATMDRILADDFVLVTGRGKIVTKADLLKEAADTDVVYERQEDSNQTVRVWGNVAVVTALLWAKGTDKGKPFDYKLWFSDTYMRTPAGWRYIFAQASISLPKAP